MKKITGLLLSLCIAWFIAKGEAAFQKFEKSTFYSAMSSHELDVINTELDLVKDAPGNSKDGYEGALLMKKASLIKKPKDKLSFFKAGRIKLEAAIMADNENTEFHFLRLAIEEHAPKIVKYHSDIEKDKSVVIKHFKNLLPTVQHAIMDYTKNSKVLHAEDF